MDTNRQQAEKQGAISLQGKIDDAPNLEYHQTKDAVLVSAG